MALTRWEPRVLDWPARWRRWFDLDFEPETWMRVEEMQEDGTLVVRAELPGIDPDKDVDVSVADGVLHISAKREAREEHKEKGAMHSEFRYGELRRDLTLPAGVDEGAVKAAYKDGILEVRIPWPTEEQVHEVTKVPVTRS